jgi:DNA replication protein DnaC
MRPIRSVISKENLSYMGVSKQYFDKTIDDLIDFDNVSEVKKFMQDYIGSIDENFENNQGIYLCGSNGTGKTFIASMIVKEAYRHRYSAMRATFVEYINVYTSVWNAKSTMEKDDLESNLYNRYKSVEFLVLEEVGKEIDSKIGSPILEDLLRYREDKSLPTIICSNLSIKVFEERYGTSCASLVKGNMIPVKIVGKDRRKDFFEERGAE